jgi:hypothetical protein
MSDFKTILFTKKEKRKGNTKIRKGVPMDDICIRLRKAGIMGFFKIFGNPFYQNTLFPTNAMPKIQNLGSTLNELKKRRRRRNKHRKIVFFLHFNKKK